MSVIMDASTIVEKKSLTFSANVPNCTYDDDDNKVARSGGSGGCDADRNRCSPGRDRRRDNPRDRDGGGLKGTDDDIKLDETEEWKL